MPEHVNDISHERGGWEFRIFNMPHHMLFPGYWKASVTLRRPRSHIKGTMMYPTREEAITAAHNLAAKWEEYWDRQGYEWRSAIK